MPSRSSLTFMRVKQCWKTATDMYTKYHSKRHMSEFRKNCCDCGEGGCGVFFLWVRDGSLGWCGVGWGVGWWGWGWDVVRVGVGWGWDLVRVGVGVADGHQIVLHSLLLPSPGHEKPWYWHCLPETRSYEPWITTFSYYKSTYPHMSQVVHVQYRVRFGWLPTSKLSVIIGVWYLIICLMSLWPLTLYQFNCRRSRSSAIFM